MEAALAGAPCDGYELDTDVHDVFVSMPRRAGAPCDIIIPRYVSIVYNLYPIMSIAGSFITPARYYHDGFNLLNTAL